MDIATNEQIPEQNFVHFEVPNYLKPVSNTLIAILFQQKIFPSNVMGFIALVRRLEKSALWNLWAVHIQTIFLAWLSLASFPRR